LSGTWLIDRINLFFRLRRYIKWVAERWFILAFCVVVGVGISAYRAIHTPEMVRATSKIGVTPKIVTEHRTQAEYREEMSTFFEKQLQYMTGDHVLSKVWQKLSETNAITKKEGFVCTPKAYKGAASLVMEVQATDFQFARDFSILWAREFLDFKNQMRKNALGKSDQDVRKEIAQQELALAAAREALEEFQRKNKIGSVKEAGDSAQDRLDKLLMEVQDITIKRQQLENRKSEEIAAGISLPSTPNSSEKTNGISGSANVTALANRSSDPLALVDNSKYNELRIKLRKNEAELQARSTTLKADHPYMQRLLVETEQTKQNLKDFLDQIEDRRRAQILSYKRDEQSLQPIIDKARKEVFASLGVQNQFARLKEDESNVKTVLDDLKRQLQSITAAPSDEGFFGIDEEGSGSPAPVSPNRPKMVLAGLVFGSVLGLGLIYLLGRLDDRLELAEDIETELEERILGQIPLVNTKELLEKRILVSRLEKHNMFAESLRGVRSAIMFSDHQGEKKVLIVSSPAPGDGKTTITTNLALSLALGGNRVLLVDADLRRGNIQAYFGWAREPGFSEVLTGEVPWRTAARETDHPNLHLITTGKMPPNPGELLISHYTEELIQEAREEYDYIIFDCPPLTSIDDAFSLVRFADGVLFVIMSGQTSMRFARAGLDAVRQRGGRILGLILNGIRPDNPYYYYQQYYYSYYTAPETDSASGSSESAAAVVKTTTVRKRSVVKPGETARRIVPPKRAPSLRSSVPTVNKPASITIRPPSSGSSEK
jgi:capsular exopolysaccharide synthesis family protein